MAARFLVYLTFFIFRWSKTGYTEINRVNRLNSVLIWLWSNAINLEVLQVTRGDAEMTSVARRREQDDSGEYSDASQDIEQNNLGNVSWTIIVVTINGLNFHFGAKSIAVAHFLPRNRVSECPFLFAKLRSQIGHHSLQNLWCYTQFRNVRSEYSIVVLTENNIWSWSSICAIKCSC